MVEEEGFEPPRGLTRLSVFKTDPFSQTWVFLQKDNMVDLVGLEPTTNRLTAGCSTTELLRNKHMVGLNGLEPSTSRLSGVRSNQLSYRPQLERVMGIEPTTSAWKAEVLPLNYTRILESGSGRNRTADTLIFSQMLYQLSY